MEATVLSVGRSVVDGAVSYAKSALAEEVALQLGVQRDQAFVSDELEMMQSFLMAAHDEPDEHKVLKTWVKQVRDVAYDVEDCLQDFAVRLETRPPWWRLPRTLRERRRIASQMKELRARVKDVSKRNLRYHLIKGPATSSSKPPTTAAAKQPGAGDGATMFGIDEARRAAAKHDKPKVDLVQLMSKEDADLGVIAVWGTGGDLGQTSVIKRAYDDLKIRDKFECRAWIRLMHPFNPTRFLQGILRQFYVSSLQEVGATQEKATLGAQVLKKMARMNQEDLVDEFSEHVHEKSYLVVLNDLWTIEDWDWIKTYFPNNKKGSRIIVSTHLVEVASLCTGQESQVSELKQLSADQTFYVFYEKGSQDGTDPTKPGSSSNAAATSANSSTVPAGEILGDKSNSADEKNVVRKITSLTRIRSMQAALKESQLIGRAKEKSDIIELISGQASQKTQVITVWGMGGLGKTTLVQDVYQSQELSSKFEKRAFVTVMRPFNRQELLRGLVRQLDAEPSEKKNAVNLVKKPATMGVEGLITELDRLLVRPKCLIVLDDVSSIVEWDLIFRNFPKMEKTSRIIVTTREENIAKHCSKEQENIYKVKGLIYKDAQDIFTRKVFKETVYLDEQYPDLVKEANLILKKCNGLPLALITIGGFLANQPKTAVEWRTLNEHISAELEMNPELETIRTVLTESYDGLPYHLKSCFLYLSIFPEDHKVSRRRLVRRWTAEGYSRDIRDKSAKEIADGYFMELIQRSMILPSQQPTHSRKGIDSCQVHDLIREIGISKSMEENLVSRLEEGCNLNSRVTVRHLAVSSTWEGDQSEFESTVDMSRIRSLTVFGKWRPFFISDKMRLLRVLDLEDTWGLVNHHLEQIGKLLHLRYLSLRGCGDIFHLPDSVGNLRQLQTLDIACTGIIKLPRTIAKLRKLQYIRAGGVGSGDADSFEELHVPKLVRNKLCLSTFLSVACCVACCSPQLLKGMFDMAGDPNRRDVCTTCCHAVFPFYVARQSPHGVQVPRGIHRLQALHTLGILNAAQGKAVLQDIQRLPRLRKLGVTGINRKNGKELCLAIAALSRLESLLLRSEGEPGLQDCLDDLSATPPENLQSLKLYGNLVKLPEWIQGLRNLVKLSLRSTRISDSELGNTIQVLGKLPNLTILRLWTESFQGDELHFSFHEGAFLSLMLLQLDSLVNLKTVIFEGGAMPKLELLQFCGWTSETNIGLFSGLPSLPSLKEVMLYGDYNDDFVQDLMAELKKNEKRPVLKRYNS